MITERKTVAPIRGKEEFVYCIFSEEDIISLPEESFWGSNHINLQINSRNYQDSELKYKDSEGEHLDNFDNYGKVVGLYWVWKNINYAYIGFSLTDNVLDIKEEEWKKFLESKNDILLKSRSLSTCSLQENYRTLYYDYDFRMMMSVLKKMQPSYYSFAKKNVIGKHEFIEPSCVIKKEVFRKFCVWLFPILKMCKDHLREKYSKHQNRYLEHLTYYLFIIYFLYHEKKLKIVYVDSSIKLLSKQKKSSLVMEFANMKGYIQYLWEQREVEMALKHLQENKELQEAKELLPIFEQYEKERRYYDITIFEKESNFERLLKNYNGNFVVKKRGKRLLIFEWASITHEETVFAFEGMGFECHTYKTPYKSYIYDEDFLEQINRHLDFNSFDLVFSVNYFAMIAEACYIHDTPYLAWCYDSPTFIGDRRYLKYPTNHVFMFDSLEMQSYQAEGFKNVHYMPLATNVSRYDKIICTPEEKEKYQASISFVGSLYDTKLTNALNYLTDYQKGYLNALVDNQLKIYGNNLFPFVISQKFLDWISTPKFNKAVKAEWEKDTGQENEKDLTVGRLELLLNKMVTNRERLLLITMLSKHWDFKLYSNASNEVFKTTIQCGTVDYYTDMPKVFRNSRINLNITLRTIEAGIPQRCIDIMGSHGLLLTNYQKDFDEFFKDQENILIYHSIEEAYEKAEFYLSHESLRKSIENKGYETVKQHFNYPDSIKKMLKIAELEYLLK